MRILYTAAMLCYGFAIRLASVSSDKARLWISGRKNERSSDHLPTTEESHTGTAVRKGRGGIWMHCASLGEFEQGRPVLDQFKQLFPDTPVLLSFFSPSGYEIRKNYPGADQVVYLPLDTPKNAEHFLKKYQPSIAIFVKYEIWHNFLYAIKKRAVPVILISAKFRSEQVYFQWWGKWFQKSLFGFSHIFTQDEESKSLLNQIGIEKVSVAGDTRFDRVLQIAQSSEHLPVIAEFCRDNRVMICGSTWGPDEDILLEFFHKNRLRYPDLKLIIVPHEISEAHIRKLMDKCPDSIRFTQNPEILPEAAVLIIDTIGMLSKIYAYAHIAYVGGGFGAGIHNVLEPAAFGVPVIFGPKYQKFREAGELISKGGAWSISETEGLSAKITALINNPAFHESAATAAGKYVKDNAGATRTILKYLPGKF